VSRGSVQPFYRRTRKRGEGRWSWAQHNRGRHDQDKAAASTARRGSAVGNRQSRGACELVGARYEARQNTGSMPGRWPVTAHCGSRLGAARRRRDALPCDGASLPAGAKQGRGEKREGGREKRAGIQIKFSQNFEQKLEKL
jgi:hypothetical protein